ncbi:NAD(P)-binding protein [Amycolatopsis sp. lyj-108]|uniref:NAD(P)-binding protein n=1 Tax=Amycolatopsis sp. lyj-108 TaxID=2789286 RepID=UPI00397926C7
MLDADADAVRSATELGARALRGDGTDRFALARATSAEVDRIVIALVPDQTAVMSTMLARELCPSAMIVTAVREDAHVPTARRVGADHAVVTAEAAGGALAGALLERRRPSRTPWAIAQRPALASDVGRELRNSDPIAVGLIRDGRRHWGAHAAGLRVAPGDQIVLLRTHTLTES